MSETIHPPRPRAGDPIAWVVRHRARLDWLLLWGGIASAMLVAAAGVVTGHWFFLSVYTAPLFLAGPMWLRLRLRKIETLPRSIVWLDAVVFALGAVRTVTIGILPYSGHTLFLTYAVAATPERGFRALVALLWLGTTAVKLWVWDDPVSWAWGLGIGAAASSLYVWLSRRAISSGGRR